MKSNCCGEKIEWVNANKHDFTGNFQYKICSKCRLPCENATPHQSKEVKGVGDGVAHKPYCDIGCDPRIGCAPLPTEETNYVKIDGKSDQIGISTEEECKECEGTPCICGYINQKMMRGEALAEEENIKFRIGGSGGGSAIHTCGEIWASEECNKKHPLISFVKISKTPEKIKVICKCDEE